MKNINKNNKINHDSNTFIHPNPNLNAIYEANKIFVGNDAAVTK